MSKDMYGKNLRDWEPGEGKDVKDTKMLNTTARESTAKDEENSLKEHVNPGGKPQGPFGTRGRC